MQRHLMVLLGLILAASASAQQGSGDAYPTKPVTVVIALAPGGPVDQEVRLHVRKMTELLKQPFVIDYKPGAGGTIGGAYVAKAAPDGYTLLSIGAGFTVFPAFYKNLSFDVIRDFAPLSLISQKTTVLLANPSFAPRNFVEYIAYASANPGKINFGHTGAGGVVHLAGAWMHSATKTQVTFISYKGAAPQLVDLVAGRLNVAPAGLLSALPLLKSGKARALVIMNDKRSNVLPGLGTVAEQGIPGYNYTTWLGFVAPAATPAPILSKLSDNFARTAKSPEVAGPLEAKGSVMIGSTPAQFRQLMVAETERWRKLVAETGIKLEK